MVKLYIYIYKLLLLLLLICISVCYVDVVKLEHLLFDDMQFFFLIFVFYFHFVPSKQMLICFGFRLSLMLEQYSNDKPVQPFHQTLSIFLFSLHFNLMAKISIMKSNCLLTEMYYYTSTNTVYVTTYYMF